MDPVLLPIYTAEVIVSLFKEQKSGLKIDERTKSQIRSIIIGRAISRSNSTACLFLIIAGSLKNGMKAIDGRR